jgi:biopolymer transport protein ExbB/TolQ
MHVIGRYKAYSPVVFTVLLLVGMLLILIFENFGLARKENNISIRLANSIQMAQLNIEKKQKSKSKSSPLLKSTDINQSKIAQTTTLEQIYSKLDSSNEENINKIKNILVSSIQEEEENYESNY